MLVLVGDVKVRLESSESDISTCSSTTGTGAALLGTGTGCLILGTGLGMLSLTTVIPVQESCERS